MRGRPIPYSREELAWIEARRALPRVAAHAQFIARFGRGDVSFNNFKALCSRRKWATGRDGRFHADQVPHNKGKPFSPPGSEKGRFKRGHQSGRAKALYKPIGTERISKDGYRQRKINDDMPLQGRWRGVHLIEWEAIHGPLPPGHALKCLDGDRTNCAPANWICIPRACLPRLAGGRHGRYPAFDDAPAELRPALMAIARLEHAARMARRSRKDRKCARS